MRSLPNNRLQQVARSPLRRKADSGVVVLMFSIPLPSTECCVSTIHKKLRRPSLQLPFILLALSDPGCACLLDVGSARVNSTELGVNYGLKKSLC